MIRRRRFSSVGGRWSRQTAGQSAEGWGTRVIDRLSADLRAAYPDMRGLSRSNIKYMRQMAAAWPDPAIGPQAVGQLPWGHIRVLLDKLEEPAARDWYVRAAVDGGWSRNVLLNQIKGQVRDRVGAAPSNFELTLPVEDSELAGQIAKDPYVFDFLGLSGRVAERDLEAALVARLRDTRLRRRARPRCWRGRPGMAREAAARRATV